MEHGGKTKKKKVDGDWLAAERNRIENKYLYNIHGYGWIILQKDRPAFEVEADRFRMIIERYVEAVKIKIAGRRSAFVKSVIKEYAPRWKRRPPSFYAVHGIRPSIEAIKQDLERIAEELFDRTVDFAPPKVDRPKEHCT